MYLRIKVDSWSPRIPSGVKWTGLQTNSLQPQHKTHRETLFDWICPGSTCLGEMTQEDLYHEVWLPEHLMVSTNSKNIYSISFWDPNTCCQSFFNHLCSPKTPIHPWQSFVKVCQLYYFARLLWTMNNTVICGVRISPNAQKNGKYIVIIYIYIIKKLNIYFEIC